MELSQLRNSLEQQVSLRTNELVSLLESTRQLSNDLSVSEARYRYIIDNSPVGIFQSNLDGKIFYGNQLLASQFECKTIEEFVEKYGGATANWLGTSDSGRTMKTILTSTELQAFEMNVHLLNGHTKWISLFSKLDSQKNQINGFTVDITNQKLLEDQLRQSQKMEAIGQLAGGIAHDFNNMLNVILSYTSLIKLDGTLAPAHREMVDKIGFTVHRAATLTNGLLTFSRQQVVEPKVLDLCEIIAEAKEIWGRLISSQIAVDYEFADEKNFGPR